MTFDCPRKWQDSPSAIHALLFDLDGTLVDSAPDLAGAANEMRLSRGLAALPLETLRPLVGTGARGMLEVALQMTPAHSDYEASRSEFLDRYEARMARETQLFDQVLELLSGLRLAGIPWGIVTNKAERFALPLTRELGLDEAAFAVIGGDTTAHAKPHPAPLLEAAKRGGIDPQRCVYIGDDERDIIAGRAAGMGTVAAGWGYLGNGKPIEAWNADIILSSPSGILKLLGLA
ncbi:phosphoglycolate phosphatase [Roseateles oligotrophus]|uniref:Phosphoglycolate phosphatase n=1 Tax=Roseateles oligotrophus TaxID=1769250 RepID=A0ABT2YHJ9_9BURK|nr:phosphoglycolate phosphatase [Roseateles oligotrophus]MCV2369430.1 phosphoglycolate phosphatase [Roseateles oligotrophus]